MILRECECIEPDGIRYNYSFILFLFLAGLLHRYVALTANAYRGKKHASCPYGGPLVRRTIHCMTNSPSTFPLRLTGLLTEILCSYDIVMSTCRYSKCVSRMAPQSGLPSRVHITETPITMQNWYKHVNWWGVVLTILVPMYACVQAIWIPLQWKTATLSLVYYFVTGFGVTAGRGVPTFSIQGDTC